jgi:hypothetical protein
MVKNKLLYIVTSAMLLTGCEIIPEAERLIPLSIQADTTGGAHLLTEFTGFRCVNCPAAAASAEALHHTYGDRLVIVSMHPASNPFTQGVAQYDYTCEAADVYYRLFGGTASTPFPTGNIDGMQTADSYLSDYQQWPALLAERMNHTTEVHLSAKAEGKDGEVRICVNCYADTEQDAGLRIWLVEDSIRGAQAMPGDSVSTSYYHRHVLRDVWGDPQGEEVHLRTIPTSHEAAIPLKEKYNRQQCSIVAVLVNKKDGHILNVTQTKVQ